MKQRIIDIHRQAGDVNLGQTLLRLARLAETEHRMQAAACLAERGSLGGMSHAQDRAEGLGPRVVVVPGRLEALMLRDRLHTEVDR